MSKQRTKHIKVYCDTSGIGLYTHFAWDKHTDNYSWDNNAADARAGVEARNVGKISPCKLGSLNGFVGTLQKMI